jgi:tRNA modification GTPase
MLPKVDTIVGVATPPGAAGVAVIRLSGGEALEVARRVVPALEGSSPERRLRLCRVVEPEGRELLDVALVCFMRGPRSYTAEDVVELQTHGGAATVAAVVSALQRAGARMAAPGEFTLRAFLNGRIDLAEAEAVGALIGAQSERARRIALRQLSGGLAEALGRLRTGCIDVLAEVEARLDFPDEELAAFPQQEVEARLTPLLAQLDELLSRVAEARLACEGARVVLLGRANVGKSSLLNALLGRERAIVHEAPGTTRDYLEDELTLGGVSLTIVDTAGQRTPQDEAEALGGVRGLEQARTADLVLLVINLAEGLTTEDQRLVQRLGDVECWAVLNQCDRVKTAVIDRVRVSFEHVLVTAAPLGTGVAELRAKLLERFAGQEQAFDELPLVSERRHEEALRWVRDRIASARAGFISLQPPELVALELRDAAQRLGQVTGDNVTEDVLEAIFSRFCIGK